MCKADPIRPIAFVLGLALAAVTTAERARGQGPGNDLFPAELFAPLPGRRVPESDLVVVFWFAWDDPAGTLRHQAYDRRKGEYTPAVDDWLKRVRRQYPGYGTEVRYINVGTRDAEQAVREAVGTEKYELLTAVVKARSLSGPGGSFSAAPARPGASPFRHRLGINGAPGSGGYAPGEPSAYPFPTPFPYPRPHP